MHEKQSNTVNSERSLKKKITPFVPSRLLALYSKYRLINESDLFNEKKTERWKRALSFLHSEMRGRDIEFTSPDGLSYVSMPNNYSSFVTCVAGARDPDIWRFISKNLKPGSVFVDAGANIGTYTLPASKLVGPTGRVISFEAHPTTFRYLQRNLEKNHVINTTAVNIALGSQLGSVDIQFNESNPGETCISKKSSATIQVKLSTLDAMIDRFEIGKIDYIKIDVECFEYPVIKGAAQIIGKNRDVIIQTELEERHAERYGHSIKETAHYLIHLGFNPYKVNKEGEPARIRNTAFGDVIWMRR